MTRRPPSWAAVPGKGKLWLEVLRGGAVVGRVDFDDVDCLLFGRLPNCDVQLDHPSISRLVGRASLCTHARTHSHNTHTHTHTHRYHAIIQCGDDGNVYVYDLGSTHGTKINKTAVPPRKHTRLRVGHMVRFGSSTRLCVRIVITARETCFPCLTAGQCWISAFHFWAILDQSVLL
jgi:pSer/pThr/pTyr-binding forkhead associated (FHA) protein